MKKVLIMGIEERVGTECTQAINELVARVKECEIEKRREIAESAKAEANKYPDSDVQDILLWMAEQIEFAEVVYENNKPA